MPDLFYSPPAETYVEADISSTDDDSTMATENGGSSSYSTEDEDGDDLAPITQNARQKMAIKVSLPSLNIRSMTQDRIEAFLASRYRQCDGY